MNWKEKLADLLTEQPLYKTVKIGAEFLQHPLRLSGFTISFYCPNEKSNQTFALALEPKNPLKRLGDNTTGHIYERYFDVFDSENNIYDYTQHYSGTCQHCKNYRIEFLLKVATNKALPLAISQDANYEGPVQIVQKIGQFPGFEIEVDKELTTFLNKEDIGNYKKSLICISQNYGIGAYAYLRRIVENEIVKIVEDLSKIDRPESAKIKELLKEFEVSHTMSNLIEGINDYLPNSLKNLGDNPFKVLYGQLSGGIHEFSEEECFDKAKQIDQLLKFVIKKINEENSEVKNVREAMKKLRESNP